MCQRTIWHICHAHLSYTVGLPYFPFQITKFVSNSHLNDSIEIPEVSFAHVKNLTLVANIAHTSASAMTYHSSLHISKAWKKQFKNTTITNFLARGVQTKISWSNAQWLWTRPNRRMYIVQLKQWCSNRGPQGPLEWPAKQFSLERKLNTLII